MWQIYRYFIGHAQIRKVFLCHKTYAPYFGVQIGTHPYRFVEAFFIAHKRAHHFLYRRVDVFDTRHVLQHIVERIKKHLAQKKARTHVAYERNDGYYHQKTQTTRHPWHKAIYTVEDNVNDIGRDGYGAENKQALQK